MDTDIIILISFGVFLAILAVVAARYKNDSGQSDSQQFEMINLQQSYSQLEKEFKNANDQIALFQKNNLNLTAENENLKLSIQSYIQTIEELKVAESNVNIKNDYFLESIIEENENFRRNIERQYSNELESQIYKQNSKSINFYAEAFISSGPRKMSDSIHALGEDTCGFAISGDKLLFWILDGTSDLNRVIDKDNGKELFSSRLLAQQIANELPSIFLSKQYNTLSSMVEQSVRQVEKSWQNKLITMGWNWSEKKSLQFGTAILVGILDLDGKLSVCRIGDSSLVAFDKSMNVMPTRLDNSMSHKSSQFFVLSQNRNGKPIVGRNKAQHQEIQLNNVDMILCHSDGVNNTIASRITQRKDTKLQVIREFIFNSHQENEDDKSLFFAKLVGNKNMQ